MISIVQLGPRATEACLTSVSLEAMSSGCICVANHAGGPVEILDGGKAGILADSATPQRYFQILEDILEYPEKYERYKTLARKRVLDKYSQSEPNFDLIIDSHFQHERSA